MFYPRIASRENGALEVLLSPNLHAIEIPNQWLGDTSLTKCILLLLVGYSSAGADDHGELCPGFFFDETRTSCRVCL